MNLKKKLTPEGILTLSWGYILKYDLYSQVYWYISQISGERLQEHWSSDLKTVVRHTYDVAKILHCKLAKISRRQVRDTHTNVVRLSRDSLTKYFGKIIRINFLNMLKTFATSSRPRKCDTRATLPDTRTIVVRQSRGNLEKTCSHFATIWRENKTRMSRNCRTNENENKATIVGTS